MLVLGTTGPIDHGKTTFSNTVAAQEPSAKQFESSSLISEVANAWQATLTQPVDPTDVEAVNSWLRKLPQILLDILHTPCRLEDVTLSSDEVELHPIEYQKLLLHLQNLKQNFSLAGQIITPENKETYRPILQWLGGYLVQKVDRGIWWNEIIRRIKEVEQAGCKLAIAAALRYPEDAAIMRQAGAKIIKVYRPGHLQNHLLDPTERERESIVPDTTIINDGSLDNLKLAAEQFYKDLVKNNLQINYHTSQF